MNQHYDPKVSIETLMSYQGYSLQVFTSGRIKLSFHITHSSRVEYYCVCPKRHRESYARQKTRSGANIPDHFALTDHVLDAAPHSLIYRVHLKADNNATADNAHVIADADQALCHVILGVLHHQWELPQATLQALLSRTGPRRGAAACFNEYIPSYDHDWGDAFFTIGDYAQGHRPPGHQSQAQYTSTPDPDFDF